MFCLAPATAALPNYGGRSVSVCLTVCPCVCLCVFSDVDVEVYKMHNLALPFHQLPFSSCPACLNFPSSSSPSLSISFSASRLVAEVIFYFYPCICLHRQPSCLALSFFFWPKNFWLASRPIPPSHSHTRICTSAHTQHSFLAPSACHSHSFSRLLSVIGYQWLTRLSFSALYVYVMTIRIDILLRSAKFTQLLSQLPFSFPSPSPIYHILLLLLLIASNPADFTVAACSFKPANPVH